MDDRATGLILRLRPLTETSLIIQWLTAEHGRLATVAKGARRPKSPFRGKLDLFFECEFTLARSRHSELHTLREVALLDSREPLRHDLARLGQLAYAANLVERTTETETPIPEIHALVKTYADWLKSHEAMAIALLAFELKLLAETGLQPDFSEIHQPAPVRQLLAALADAPWPELAQIQAVPQDVEGANHFLHGFLIFHLGRLPPHRDEAVHGRI